MTRAARAGPAGKLPLHVRAMRRLSARGLPQPVCSVTVESGIAVPAGDGTKLLTDHYIPRTHGPRRNAMIRPKSVAAHARRLDRARRNCDLGSGPISGMACQNQRSSRRYGVPGGVPLGALSSKLR
jgi:predicted acyl esterase